MSTDIDADDDRRDADSGIFSTSRNPAGRRRRRRRGLSPGVKAALIVSCAAIVGLVVVIAASSSNSRNPGGSGIAGDRGGVNGNKVGATVSRVSESDAISWNHQDLISHLKARGVKIAMAVPAKTGSFHGPAMYFLRSPESEAQLAGIDFTFRNGVYDDRCYVQILKTPQDAKDQSGPAGGWSWSRFLITGDNSYLAEIRRALN